MIEAAIDYQAVNPGGKRGIAAEIADAGKQLQEGVLRSTSSRSDPSSTIGEVRSLAKTVMGWNSFALFYYRPGVETQPLLPKRLQAAVGPLSRFLVAGFAGRCGGRTRVGGRARIRPKSQGIAPNARRYRL